MFWEGLSAARDLGRLQDIATILIRYGFGDMVQRLGLSLALERAGRALNWKNTELLKHMESPERVSKALQDLGPTFIKLGQILATRIDLFSSDWIAEFEKLQDQLPSEAFEKLRPQLEEDLGGPLENLFPYLETKALAAASMAQVHRAQLHDGTQVILKILRPGIHAKINADLRLLQRFAEIAEQEITELKHYHPTQIVRQFSRSLRRELDLAVECRNAERIATKFRDNPNIVIPKIYWEWTSERLNVQEYIAGIPGRDIASLDKSGLDRKLLAKYGANAIFQMILVDGFFHADPHPGNVFYLAENRIAFIDFGMVGRLSDIRRQQVIRLLYGLVKQNSNDVVDILMEWSNDISTDIQNLSMDVDAFIDHYHSVPLKHLKLTGMLSDLTVLLRDYHLSLPSDLALLFKSFITLEGLGKQLDPEFDLVTTATPYLQRAFMERYAPDAIAKRGWHNLLEILDVITSLPQDLRRLLSAARRGHLQVHVDLTRLDRFGDQLDRAASRLTIGLITAALIIGSSIAMTVQGGPSLFGLPALGVIGFVGAAFGGFWVLLSSRNKKRN